MKVAQLLPVFGRICADDDGIGACVRWLGSEADSCATAFGAGSSFGWSLATVRLISWLAYNSPTATSYIATWTTATVPLAGAAAASTALGQRDHGVVDGKWDDLAPQA